MAVPTIPPRERKEWEMLVRGDIQYEFRNYVLQIKIYQLRKDIERNLKSIDEAADLLFQLCNKYVIAVQDDMKNIFRAW